MLFVVFACIFVIAILVMAIMFLLTLQRLLNRCQSRNRDMQPGMVWLNLVPCLNIVWQFLTVIWISSTLQKEYRSRRMDTEGSDFGRTLGLGCLILSISTNILSRVIQVVGNINKDETIVLAGAGIALLGGGISFCLWLAYWFKMSGYSQALSEYRSSDDYGRDDYGRDERDRPWERDDSPRHDGPRDDEYDRFGPYDRR